MTDDKCIFCKIANGEIPSATVYEDDMFRVILDLGPATRGHALILPKNHFADVCALDEKTAAKVLAIGAKVGAAMKEGLGCAGFNLVQNNGEAAGQTVMHFHMHVIVSIPEQRKSRMLQCRSSGKPRTSILRRLSW